MGMFGIIGGSGFESIAGLANIETIEAKTRYGDASVLVGELAAKRIAFVSRHGANHQLPPHKINYRANLAALKKIGAESIIATNAVGGICKNLAPGSFAIPDQIIDYTWGREHTFYSEFADEMQHVEFTHPFTQSLRLELLRSLKALRQPVVDGGCYACTQGPRLETAAEIAKFQKDGCTMVGMTGMPEAALAREAGIPYASLCFSVNWAAGIADDISMDEIKRYLNSCVSTINALWPLLLD